MEMIFTRTPYGSFPGSVRQRSIMYWIMSHPYVLSIRLLLIGHVVYRIVNNLFLFPLAKIPGLLLPAIMSWYEVYFDCIYKGGGQYPFHLRELRQRYSPIIRLVPDQVEISDPSFLDVIYATRERNFPVHKGLNVDHSIAGAEDFELHRVRREALNHTFNSEKSAKPAASDHSKDREGDYCIG